MGTGAAIIGERVVRVCSFVRVQLVRVWRVPPTLAPLRIAEHQAAPGRQQWDHLMVEAP